MNEVSNPALRVDRDEPLEQDEWGGGAAGPGDVNTVDEADRHTPADELRIALVGVTYAVPGGLAGLMAHLAFGFAADPAVSASVGAAVFALAGGWMESAG